MNTALSLRDLFKNGIYVCPSPTKPTFEETPCTINNDKVTFFVDVRMAMPQIMTKLMNSHIPTDLPPVEGGIPRGE
jgi:hypothetical protein